MARPKKTKESKGVEFKCLTGNHLSYGVEFTPKGVIQNPVYIEKARANPDFEEL